MPVKIVPKLKRKKTHQISPNSLTAALNWDKLADASMGDVKLPLATGNSFLDIVRKKRGRG